jgi:hypothetical protein
MQELETMNLTRIAIAILLPALSAAAFAQHDVPVPAGYLRLGAPAADPLAPILRESPTPQVLPAATIHETPRPTYSEPVAPLSFAESAAARVEVSVGTRILLVELLDDAQGRPFENSFIGSIYKLDADQEYLPLRPFVQATLPAGAFRLGLGASYDQLSVATRDDGGGDGDVEMKGLLLYAVASCPNASAFTPFAELGAALYDNSFDPIPSWSEGGLRTFRLDDSAAPYIALGCDARLDDRWAIQLYARYADVDVDGVYVFQGDSRPPESFTFTLEHLAFGVGLQCSF